MPTPQISAQEQLMMELLNRARLDPQGEAARYGIDLNQGLTAGTISSAPKAPLAFNVDLNEAAAGHSEWMLATDTFSHTGSGGSSSFSRMKAAGYTFTGSWAAGENISWRGTTGTLDTTSAILEQHKSLFLSSGHRKNIMGDFREVGVAQEVGNFKGYNASMITQDFAKTGTSAFITGVAYTDLDNDCFYDVGEGKSGIVIDWLGNTGGATSTASAGGYNVAIPTGLTSTAAVSITVGSTTIQASLGMTGTNVKLDVINGRILASSTDLTLGTNGTDARLLGVANTKLTGNSAANILEGNGGANELRGMSGSDTLIANGGNDRLEGGTGNDQLRGGAGADSFVFTVATGSPTGADRILDLAADDRITIDLSGTLPVESVWEDSHISATSTGCSITLDDGSTIQVDNVSVPTLESVLVLV